MFMLYKMSRIPVISCTFNVIFWLVERLFVLMLNEIGPRDLYR